MMRLMTMALVLWFVTAAAYAAQDAERPDPKKYAFTDISQVDEDFAFQGEYGGVVRLAGHGRCWTGLQVVARGGGDFEAVLLPGGLPGNGWNRETRIPLAGSLDGGVLTLTNDDYSIACDGSTATASDAAGSYLGDFVKIKRRSQLLGAKPPANAVVLFDGESTENLADAQITEDGTLGVGFTTAMPVGDFRLHIEFKTPYMPYASGQSRGNSGCYIQRRYEVQILDSFGLEGVQNECGGLYKQHAPDVNMALPPLSWQSYDIWFTAPRWDGEGNKIANARLTVLHNGIPIHNNREVKNKTGAGQLEGPSKNPILFQNHGDQVRYRNMWIVLLDEQPAPSMAKKTCCSKRRGVRRLLSRFRRRR